MRSKSLLIGLIVVLALLAVIGVADAQPPGMPPLKKLSKAERAKARCGGMCLFYSNLPLSYFYTRIEAVINGLRV